MRKVIKYRNRCGKWRRSCRQNMSVTVSLVMLLDFQITSYVNDFQTLDKPGSWQHMHRKIRYLPFLPKSFILDVVKLAELSNNGFEWKNMIFFFGGGGWSKHTMTLFFRGQDPQPSGSTPLECNKPRHLGPDLKYLDNMHSSLDIIV